MRINITLFRGKNSNDPVETDLTYQERYDDFELSSVSNQYVNDDRGTRPACVEETESFFHSLTLPPHLPSRRYTEDKTKVSFCFTISLVVVVVVVVIIVISSCYYPCFLFII